MVSNNDITIYLKPGELYATKEPVVIKTVLGSCIAVCLHDKINKVGGANHYLLPCSKNQEDLPLNYAENSIPELINMVLKEGGNKRNLVAQLVGGCSRGTGTILNVGKRNIDVAHKILSEHSIPIIYQQVGGSKGRVIRFFPYTNELQVRQAGVPEGRVKSTNSEEKFVQLAESKAYFLKDMFSVSLERAEKSLSSMVGSNSNIIVSEIMIRKMGYVQNYVKSNFSNFLIHTGQREEGMIGEVLMLAEPDKMGYLVNKLLRKNLNEPVKYSGLESSVVLEVANIVLNAILGTLANHLKFRMMLRVTKLLQEKESLDTLRFMEKSKQWKLCLAAKNRLLIPALNINTLMLLVVELTSPYCFFQKLTQAENAKSASQKIMRS